MTRHPPDILITTPESLYLMLTSQAREIFAGVEAVIVDEIHAVAQTKRGAHLALTLERLEQAADGPVAAHRPVRDAEPARGGRPLHGRPEADVPRRRRRRAQAARPEDPRAGRVDGRARAVATSSSTRSPAARRRASRSGRRSTPRSSSSSASTARRSSSSTTAAAPSASRCGSTSSPPARTPTGPRRRDRPRPPRLAGARGAARRRGAAQGRRAAVPGRDLVPRARHRHGRRRPRAAGRVAEVGHARPAAHRPRRPQRRRHLQGPHLPQVPRRPARVRGRRPAHARGPDRDDRRAAQPARRARPADRRDGGLAPTTRTSRWSSTTCYALVTRTHSYAELSRAQLENVLDMLDGRYPSEEFGELRPRIVWDRVGGHDPRPQGRARARDHQRRHDPRPRPVLRQPARRPPRRRARRGDGLRGAPGPDVPARRVDAGGSRRSRRDRVDRHARARACRARCRSGAATASAARASSARRSARSPLGGRAGRRRRSRRGYDLDHARRAEPARLPARAAGRHARRPERPHDRRRALPRRDRRLARCASSRPTAAACTPPGASR